MMAFAQVDLGRLTLPPPARLSGPPGLRRPVLTMLALVFLSAVAIGVAVALSPALGVVAVAAVAATLVLAQRPERAVYLLVLVAPACAGLQRGLLVPGLRVSEAAIVGLGALVLIFAPRARRPAWSGVEYALLAYAAFTVMLGGYDLAIRHAALDFEELGTLLGPFQFVVLLRAVIVAMGREKHRVRAAQLMLGAATVVALLALAQAADLGPTRSVLTTLTGGSLYSKSLGLGVGRITGPFNIWHELAGFLMPSILLSLSLGLSPGSRALQVRYGLVCVVTTMALISTAAAGILIATTLGAIYICWKHRVLHIALALAVPVVLIAALAFSSILGHRAEQQYVTPSATAYQNPLCAPVRLLPLLPFSRAECASASGKVGDRLRTGLASAVVAEQLSLFRDRLCQCPAAGWGGAPRPLPVVDCGHLANRPPCAAAGGDRLPVVGGDRRVGDDDRLRLLAANRVLPARRRATTCLLGLGRPDAGRFGQPGG